MATHVCKLGGSLLNHPGVDERLREMFARSKQRRTVLLVGGGEPVDWLRRLDAVAPINDRAAHEAAIAMMDANTRAVAGWLSTATVTDRWDEVRSDRPRTGVLLFAAGRFLREQEPTLPGIRLPVGWQVTSDSIAARVAALLDTPLTLLKSCDVETPRDQQAWVELSGRGVVDPFFPSLAGELPSVEIATLGGA